MERDIKYKTGRIFLTALLSLCTVQITSNALAEEASSDNFKDLVSSEVDLRDTWGFEFYYNFAINKWLHLSADLQLANNQRADDDFAIIPGARLVVDF